MTCGCQKNDDRNVDELHHRIMTSCCEDGLQLSPALLSIRRPPGITFPILTEFPNSQRCVPHSTPSAVSAGVVSLVS